MAHGFFRPAWAVGYTDPFSHLPRSLGFSRQLGDWPGVNLPELSHVHDRFFKAALARPEVAADFLANYLPPAVARELDLATIERRQGSFVDPDLREHVTDLLFHVRLRSGGEAHVYVLFEHKSTPDRLVALQLLRYLVRIWDEALRRREPLAPIIPLVFCHGRERWAVAREFGALYWGPEALRAYWPDFRYELVNLSPDSQTEIRGEVLLRVTPEVLRHIHSADLGGRLPELVGLLWQLADKQTALEYLEVILRYAAGASDVVTREDLERAVAAAIPESGGVLMPTLAEQWIEEGRQEGRIEGTRSGLLAGMGPALELKFGTDGLVLLSELCEIDDVLVLRSVADTIRTARTVDDLRRLCR